MDIAKAHRYFDTVFHCARGFSLRAQLLMAPLEESATYFLNSRRILKTDAKSMLRPGDVVTSSASGYTWLCGDNGPSEFQGRVIYKSFKLFEVTHKTATWTRHGATKDPITALEVKDPEPVTLGTIPVAIEFLKLQEDEMRIPADMVRIVASADIKVGDHINGLKVTNVETQLGLRFITAKRQ